MVLSTQVARQDRQSASLYPFPETPLLGVATLLSSGIVTVILADFLAELMAEDMSVPNALILTLVAASATLLEQTSAFVRQRYTTYPAKLNFWCHLVLTLVWLAAFVWLTYSLHRLVLGASCSLSTWRNDRGVMVCRIYKVMYSFAAIALATCAGNTVLDRIVWKNGTAGVYQPVVTNNPATIESVKTPMLES